MATALQWRNLIVILAAHCTKDEMIALVIDINFSHRYHDLERGCNDFTLKQASTITNIT